MKENHIQKLINIKYQTSAINSGIVNIVPIYDLRTKSAYKYIMPGPYYLAEI